MAWDIQSFFSISCYSARLGSFSQCFSNAKAIWNAAVQLIHRPKLWFPQFRVLKQSIKTVQWFFRTCFKSYISRIVSTNFVFVWVHEVDNSISAIMLTFNESTSSTWLSLVYIPLDLRKRFSYHHGFWEPLIANYIMSKRRRTSSIAGRHDDDDNSEASTSSGPTMRKRRKIFDPVSKSIELRYFLK